MNTTKQLTIAHLSPYLPYGLKVMTCNDSIGLLIGINTNHTNLGKMTIIQDDSYEFSYYSIELIEPILKPLIEIKNYPEIMDEFSEYSWDSFENAFFMKGLGRSLDCMDVVNYTIAQLCFKHHLDLFGLLDDELAVNYNTLNQ